MDFKIEVLGNDDNYEIFEDKLADNYEKSKKFEKRERIIRGFTFNINKNIITYAGAVRVILPTDCNQFEVYGILHELKKIKRPYPFNPHEWATKAKIRLGLHKHYNWEYFGSPLPILKEKYMAGKLEAEFAN